MLSVLSVLFVGSVGSVGSVGKISIRRLQGVTSILHHKLTIESYTFHSVVTVSSPRAPPRSSPRAPPPSTSRAPPPSTSSVVAPSMQCNKKSHLHPHSSHTVSQSVFCTLKYLPANMSGLGIYRSAGCRYAARLAAKTCPRAISVLSMLIRANPC